MDFSLRRLPAWLLPGGVAAGVLLALLVWGQAERHATQVLPGIYEAEVKPGGLYWVQYEGGSVKLIITDALLAILHEEESASGKLVGKPGAQEFRFSESPVVGVVLAELEDAAEKSPIRVFAGESGFRLRLGSGNKWDLAFHSVGNDSQKTAAVKLALTRFDVSGE